MARSLPEFRVLSRVDIPIYIRNIFPYILKAINAQSDETSLPSAWIQKQMYPNLVPCSVHGVVHPYVFFLSSLPLRILSPVFVSSVVAFALSLLVIPVL